ncbi:MULTISPECIES: DUF3558 family protein [unclassified Streptomyces]|uniref:DUF3558 family protein n=1 Tax=unclassified Streptomyces TaxID=2593676 RepID=UPI003D707326
MSEGTMQRRAQRDDQSHRRAERTADMPRPDGTRPVRRAPRALAVAAALPVLLLASACSSGSGGDSGSGSASGSSAERDAGASASATASPSPTVPAATYASLPKACATLPKKTLGELVPEAEPAGKPGSTDEPGTRASCSWSSLDNNGVKGSQFRWLNVSLVRFESDVTRGSGDDLAKDHYTRQVEDLRTVPDAKNTKSAALAGAGDQATSVRYDLKKKEGAFKQQTVVVRAGNVVVTVDYNGAGLAGDKTPDADGLAKLAEKAAKEAVASVRAANEPKASGTPAPAASKPASSAPSASASASASQKS